jgi:rod shape-determining protein MreB
MFSAVFGLFSQDLAVDLGTTGTRIYQRGSGVVCDEPTIVAVFSDPRGARRVLAIGEQALPMVGRTPGDIRLVQPVRVGQVADFEVAEAFLLQLVRRVHGRNAWMSPRMVVAVPHQATDMERRAVRESCEAAGAREVHLVPRPVAAALGAGLPIEQASGHMVVDLGGGTTEVSIVSMHGVVASTCVPGGGEAMDEAIIAWLAEKERLLVGRPTAERVKIELGNAVDDGWLATAQVAGRCLERRIPRSVEVTSDHIRDALTPRVLEVAEAIRGVLEECPPELAGDIVDNGVVLTGGGSALRGLDLALGQLTGLPVVTAEEPRRAVALGAGRILETASVLRAVAV